MRQKHRRRVDWIDSSVQCPYYYECDGNAVQCEGFSDGMTTVHSFRSKAERIDFMNVYCCDEYKSCPDYMINEIKHG